MHTEHREFGNQQEWATNKIGSGMSMIREIKQLKKEICWSQRVFISVHVRPPTCPVNSSVCGGEAERKRACTWSPCVFVHLPCICIPVSSLSRGKATWDEGHVWLKIYLKRKKMVLLLNESWWGHEEQTFLIRLLDDMTQDVKCPHLPSWGERSDFFLFQSQSSWPKPRVSCVAALPGSVYLPSFQGLLSKHTVCVHLFPSSIAQCLPLPACALLLWLLWSGWKRILMRFTLSL